MFRHIMVLGMNSYYQDFNTDVERFLFRHDMLATQFGVLAMKDPTFIFRLRGGREPKLSTCEKIRTWMNDYADVQAQKARAP